MVPDLVGLGQPMNSLPYAFHERPAHEWVFVRLRDEVAIALECVIHRASVVDEQLRLLLGECHLLRLF